MKVHKVEIMKMENVSKEPGTIIELDSKGIIIQAKEGVIKIVEVTFEGEQRSGIDKIINKNLILKSEKFE